MTFSLNTKIIYPDKENEIKNAIILLHGYGGDSNDISILSLNWKRFLPNTIFLCPDGHQQCPINPRGFQWFDLSKDDPIYILDESIKALGIYHISIKLDSDLKTEIKIYVIKT